MRRLVQGMTLLFTAFLLFRPAAAQELPGGPYHPVREREINLLHLRADLSVNPEEKSLSGRAEIRFVPLRNLRSFSLDAVRLNVQEVKLQHGERFLPVDFENLPGKLELKPHRIITPADTLTLTVRYSCRPNAGVFFQRDVEHSGKWFVFTYGEGGLSANWLPIYSDVNDKFSTEMVVTVPQGYQVISNGKLMETRRRGGGTVMFHWLQKLPHSSYLIALYIGDFEQGRLGDVNGVPVRFWVPRGHLREGEFVFRNTPKMISFFSRRFGYFYPWVKYDQVAVPDYAIGGMEHTTVTGVRASVLRLPPAPDDSSPRLEDYFNIWSTDGLISHELAHHWFGDNLTCNSLSAIWLNESFATYAQMLWDEEDHGEKSFSLYRIKALDYYLDYVRSKHEIRPLEWSYYRAPDDMYTLQLTYYKGALILHMMRRLLGDEAFFRTLGRYLQKHAFSNVDSHDFLRAVQNATGRNLEDFFRQWIYGAGHPVLEVQQHYFGPQRLLRLEISQVQPQVKKQGVFRFPAEIWIWNGGTVLRDTLWVRKKQEAVFIPLRSAPDLVCVDPRGDLVAEIRVEKSLGEWVRQVQRAPLAAQFRALRALADRYSAAPRTVRAFAGVIRSGSFWGLRAEACRLLGKLGSASALKLAGRALRDPDARVRKAAVLGLAGFGADRAVSLLRRVVRKDPHPDVVAAAVLALGKLDARGERDFIAAQIGRKSWYREITLAAVQALGMTGEESVVPLIRAYAEKKYNQHLRAAALDAWAACAPGDSALHNILLQAVTSAPYDLRQQAIRMLGNLGVVSALPLLQKVAGESGDTNLRVLAKRAVSRLQKLRQAAALAKP